MGPVWSDGKRRIAVCAGSIGLMLLCSEASSFQANIRGIAGRGFATSVALDPAGNIVAGGVLTDFFSGTGNDFAVAKFSGQDGSELWRRVINGTDNGPRSLGGVANAVAVDENGDVFAAGQTFNIGTDWDITIVKLAGADGTEIWRRIINGTANGGDLGLGLTLDGTGDVIAGGSVQNSPGIGTPVVIKLSGVDGLQIWRQEIITSGAVLAVALTAADDVIAASGSGISKLSGATGAFVWMVFPEVTPQPESLALDAAGDVFVGGFGDLGLFTVFKLSGIDGHELWSQHIGASSVEGTAMQVRVDVAGNVVAAGGITEGNQESFAVAKFAGLTGDVLWERDIHGTQPQGGPPFGDQANGVALDSFGDVFAAGQTGNVGTCVDFTVVKLSRFDGSVIWRKDVNGISGGVNGISGGSDCAAAAVHPGLDSAAAVVVDSAGNPVAVGSLLNVSVDFTVIKFKGTDGSGGATTASIVSGLLTLDSTMTAFHAAPVPNGPAGTFTVDARFTNTSADTIHAPALVVSKLTNGNLLLNADDATITAGARLTPDVGADGVLSPGESLSVRFVVGLAVRKSFRFTVEVVGTVGP